MGDEQRQFLGEFDRFVKSGLSPAEFSDAVYRQLISTFGFPICGGKQGFHYYWFEFPRLGEFTRRVAGHAGCETWSPVGREMAAMLAARQV